MASRDNWDCLYVWEGAIDEFHGLVGSSSNSPSRWGCIIWGHFLSLDVLLREVHEEIEGFIRKREKLEGFMAEGYISYESLYYASEYIKHIDNTPGGRKTRRSASWNELKEAHDKE